MGVEVASEMAEDGVEFLARPSWFVCDVINVTIDWILDLMHTYSLTALADRQPLAACLVKYVLIIMKFAARLVRFLKMNKTTDSLKRRLISETLIAKANIFQLSCQVLLIQHVMACAWYSIGDADEVGWVHMHKLNFESPEYRYATSLHWMFCQLGFGSTNIEAATFVERVFGILTAFMALVVFSTILGAITTRTTQLNRAAEDRRNQFRQLRKYLLQHRVNDELCLRITGFLENAFNVRQAAVLESQVELLGYLSKPLTAELQYAKFESCLKELILIKPNCSPEPYDLLTRQVMKNLANDALMHCTFAPADSVFEAETVASVAYFLNSGSLKYVLNGREARVVDNRWLVEMCLWTPWNHLGELTTEDATELVLLQVERFASCVRKTGKGHGVARTIARHVVESMNNLEVLTDLWQCPLQHVSESSQRNGRGFFQKLMSADLSPVVPLQSLQ
ncbi:KCNH2 [Symbiodinium pilosum]|uniref:KCNH2 protein n=1 Tax=Symbiodinium pilosum TaxID=2952 RepID=A0A812KNF9_SYMPI|nr:KCNH2 [Symbiodinium pilosum]